MNQLQSDWRSNCSKIQDFYTSILLSGHFSDVTFLIQDVGEEEPTSIKAHQFILKIRSSVFETMFDEIWTSNDTSAIDKFNNPHQVKLVDTTVEYFNGFLQFIYTDYFNDASTKEFVIGLLYLAHKYIVTPLAQKCSDYLEKIICLKNVIEIYELSELFEQDNLRDAAFDFMLKYARALAVEPTFLEIRVPLLTKLITDDTLQIEEINLFRALLKWTNHKTSTDPQNDNSNSMNLTKLRKIIHLVRFTTMEPHEFSSILDTVSEMIDNHDIIKIYKHLTITSPGLKNSLPKLRLNTNRRYLKQFEAGLPQRYTINLYLYAETCDRNRLNYIYGPSGRIHDESLQFTTNQDVIIFGIGLYGPSLPLATNYNICNHQVDLAIYSLEMDSGHPRLILSRVRRSLIVPTDYEISFDTPVSVQKDKLYHIQLAFKGEETKHGVSRLSTVKTKCDETLVIFNLVSPSFVDGLHSQPQGRIRSISFQLNN